jgi:hypothetical protein
MTLGQSTETHACEITAIETKIDIRRLPYAPTQELQFGSTSWTFLVPVVPL